MTSSEERREVAEAIRHYAKESDESAYEFIRGYWPNDLADLIDPTCHVVGTTSEEGLYDGLTIFRHELSCGHTCETVWLEPPAHCDECGCRVVSDDE